MDEQREEVEGGGRVPVPPLGAPDPGGRRVTTEVLHPQQDAVVGDPDRRGVGNAVQRDRAALVVVVAGDVEPIEEVRQPSGFHGGEDDPGEAVLLALDRGEHELLPLSELREQGGVVFLAIRIARVGSGGGRDRVVVVGEESRHRHPRERSAGPPTLQRQGLDESG